LLPLSVSSPYVEFSIGLPRLGIEFVARLIEEGDVAHVGLNLVAVAASVFFFKAWRTPDPRSGAAVPESKP